MRLIFLLLATLPVFCQAQYDNLHQYATTYSSSKSTVELTIVITPSTDGSDTYRLELLYFETSTKTGISYSKHELYFTQLIGRQLYVSKDASSVPTKKASGTITEGAIILTDFEMLSPKPDDVKEIQFLRQGVIEMDAAGPDEDMLPPPPPDPPDAQISYEIADPVEAVVDDEEIEELDLIGFEEYIEEIDSSDDDEGCDWCMMTGAEFPGGKDSLWNFIRNNIQYPQEAGCTEGVVYVKFVIEKDGSLSNFEVLRGVSDSLDKEAIRVLSSMPKWQPAVNGCGVAVRQYYQLPVRFKFER